MDFYWAFLKMEKHCDAELESCFTNCIIQWIRALDKREVGDLPPLLGLLEASTSHLVDSFTDLCWVKRVEKGLSETAASPQSP